MPVNRQFRNSVHIIVREEENLLSSLDRIKSVLNERGMSLRELADKIGINEKSAYHWSKNRPSGSQLISIANTLHVSTDYILELSDDPVPKEHAKAIEMILSTEKLTFGAGDVSDVDSVAILEFLKNYFQRDPVGIETVAKFIRKQKES